MYTQNEEDETEFSYINATETVLDLPRTNRWDLSSDFRLCKNLQNFSFSKRFKISDRRSSIVKIFTFKNRCKVESDFNFWKV